MIVFKKKSTGEWINWIETGKWSASTILDETNAKDNIYEHINEIIEDLKCKFDDIEIIENYPFIPLKCTVKTTLDIDVTDYKPTWFQYMDSVIRKISGIGWYQFKDDFNKKTYELHLNGNVDSETIIEKIRINLNKKIDEQRSN